LTSAPAGSAACLPARRRSECPRDALLPPSEQAPCPAAGPGCPCTPAARQSPRRSSCANALRGQHLEHALNLLIRVVEVGRKPHEVAMDAGDDVSCVEVAKHFLRGRPRLAKGHDT